MQGQCFFGVFISCASIPCHFTSFQSVHSWHRVQTLSQSGSYKSDVVDEWPNIDFLCRLIIMFLTWCHRCKVSHSVEGNAVVYCITFNRDHLYRHHKVLFTCFLFCIANAIYFNGCLDILASHLITELIVRRAVSGLGWLTTSAKQFLVFHLTSAFFSPLCESKFKCIIPRQTLLVLVTYLEDRCSSPGWKQADCCLLADKCSHLWHLPEAQPAAAICVTHYCDILAGKEWQSWKAWLTDSCYIVSSAFLFLLLYSLYSKILVYFYLFSLSDYYASANFSPCTPTPHLSCSHVLSHVWPGCGGVPLWGA